jgi:transposase-like protein
MARAKRFTAEQIVVKLREAESLQARGATVPAVCKKLGISEQTFYRWRSKYGALKEDEAHRLKALEQENAVNGRPKLIPCGSPNIDPLGSGQLRLVRSSLVSSSRRWRVR